MSVPSQAGQIGFAVQNAGKYLEVTGDGEDLSVIDAWDWKYHKALGADLSPQQFVDSLPPEVGGGLFVDHTYKNGAFAAGGMSLAARLEDSLGHLLYAVSGAYSGVGAGETKFTVDPADDTKLPWISLKRWVPGSQEGNAARTGQLEYFLNCRIGALAITVPQMGPMRTEFSFVGQKPVWLDALEPKMDVDYDDPDSLGLAVSSKVTLSDFTNAELPDGGKFTGLQIILANQFSTPQQEMYLGSYYPDDFVALGRSAMIRLVYKWKDPAFYRALWMQAAASNGKRYWSPTVKSSPISIDVKSVVDITGHVGTVHKFNFSAPRIKWTMTPPALAAQQMISVEVTGMIHQSRDSGVPSWSTSLQNYIVYDFAP